MKTIKRALLSILLAAIAAPVFFPARTASAAADPVTIETKWNVKTFARLETGTSSGTWDVGGFGAQAYAIIGNTYTQNGVDGTTYGASATVSSNTPNTVGFSYTILPTGSSVTFRIIQTLKTPPPAGVTVRVSSAPLGFNSPAPMAYAFSAPLVSTSSVITVLAGVPFSDTWPAQVSNPVFLWSSLAPGGTVLFTLDYGVPRIQ